MATLETHRSFELRDNLDVIAGVTLTWRLSSTPATPAAAFDAERERMQLGDEYRCSALSPQIIFARECRDATQSYRTESKETRKLTCTPPHKDAELWSFSFTVARKGTRVGAETVHVGRVSLDLATADVNWNFFEFDRHAGESDEAYLGRRIESLPLALDVQDVKRYAHAAQNITKKVATFAGCVDVSTYRLTVHSVLSANPAFKISQGTYFVPNDPSLGEKNPVLAAERLKDLIEAVNPENAIYLIPIFPSRDAIAAASTGAAESIDAKIAELSEQLDNVAFSRKNAEETWLGRWDSVEAEAKLYHRLLGMQLDEFTGKIADARKAVAEKAASVAGERAAKAEAKAEARKARAAKLKAKEAALDAEVAAEASA